MRYEAKVKRRFLGLPSDITSNLIQNVSQWYDRNTDAIIVELANKVDDKLNNKSHLNHIAREFPPCITVDQAVMNMMFAVSRSRTIVNYEDRHYCLEHDALIDKQHINSCSLLGGMGDITRYVDTLNNTELRYLDKKTADSVQVFYNWLV